MGTVKAQYPEFAENFKKQLDEITNSVENLEKPSRHAETGNEDVGKFFDMMVGSIGMILFRLKCPLSVEEIESMHRESMGEIVSSLYE